MNISVFPFGALSLSFNVLTFKSVLYAISLHGSKPIIQCFKANLYCFVLKK